MTGRTSDDAPPDTPEPPEGSSGAISGEVLPVGYLTEEEFQARSGHHGRRKWRTGYLDDDDIAEIISMLAQEIPLRIIAAKFGISHETVRRYGMNHLRRRAQDGEKIAEIRAGIVINHEAVRREAWRMFYSTDSAAVKKDALALVTQTNRFLARLQGAEMPLKLKAEVEVTEVDPADIKIREMINEAQAKAAADKARIEAEFKAGGA